MNRQRRWRVQAPGVVALLFGFVLSSSAMGCGNVDDVHVNVGGAAGSAAGSGGSSAGDGSGVKGGETQAPAGSCGAGERRCSGDVPQGCEDGEWVSEDACPKGQACSGAGVCSAFRFVGGVDTFAQTAPVDGTGLVLRNQTLRAGLRACAEKLCVTGDVR